MRAKVAKVAGKGGMGQRKGKGSRGNVGKVASKGGVVRVRQQQQGQCG